MNSIECTNHLGLTKTQYCETCNQLMCMKCQLGHNKDKAEKHPICSVNDIAMRCAEILESRRKSVDIGDITYQQLSVSKVTLTKHAEEAEKLKASLKKEINDIIDEFFASAILRPISDLMEEFAKVENEVKAAQAFSEEITTQIDSIISLYYTEKNYTEVCEKYLILSKELTPSFDFSTNLEQVQNRISDFKLHDVITEVKVSIWDLLTNSMFIEAGCAKCKKGFPKKKCPKCKTPFLLCEVCLKRPCISCGNALPQKELCNKCTPDIKACDKCLDYAQKICWTNGFKTMQGGSGVWSTFCTTKPLPKYFRCSVKIHEYNNPQSGWRYVGLSANSCTDVGSYFSKAVAWWALHNNNGIWSKSDGYKGRGGVTYEKAGDIVTIIYDREKTIKFEVNGKDTGQSFQYIEGPFYLACADCSHSHFEIVDLTFL